MKVKNIEYPTPFSRIKDIEDGNIDVLVELEDGLKYTVVVSTPKNFYWYMEKEGTNHYCGIPYIIVKELTRENIEKAITEYTEEDAYWLKYYHLAGILDLKAMDDIIKRYHDKNGEILKLR